MTVVLLHGAWHGPRCWDPLRALLDDAGIASVAVALPVGDPAAGIADYVAAAHDQGGRIDGSDIAVGHSMGGLIAPLLPAGRIILLTSLIPEPGLSARQQARARGTFSAAFREVQQLPRNDGATAMPAAAARALFYNDCPDDVADDAAAHLVPQCWGAFVDPSPLTSWGSRPTTVVIAARDRVLEPAPMRDLARSIDADVVDIDADHSPMLSRPDLVASIISSP